MSEKQTKKRKVERGHFQKKMEIWLFFHFGQSLKYSEIVWTLKEYNIKTHYYTKREKQYKNLTEQLRIDKFNEMEKNFGKHQAVKVSFVVGQTLASIETLYGWRDDKRMSDYVVNTF